MRGDELRFSGRELSPVFGKNWQSVGRSALVGFNSIDLKNPAFYKT